MLFSESQDGAQKRENISRLAGGRRQSKYLLFCEIQIRVPTITAMVYIFSRNCLGKKAC